MIVSDLACCFFKVKELVHPDIYDAYGNNALRFLDASLFPVLVHLRSKFGPCLVNGGRYKNSGLRYNFGSPGSMHRSGKAYDLRFSDVSTEVVHKYIRNNQGLLYELGLRRVENLEYTPSWVHIDSKPTPLIAEIGEVYFFNP